MTIPAMPPPDTAEAQNKCVNKKRQQPFAIEKELKTAYLQPILKHTHKFWRKKESVRVLWTKRSAQGLPAALVGEGVVKSEMQLVITVDGNITKDSPFNNTVTSTVPGPMEAEHTRVLIEEELTIIESVSKVCKKQTCSLRGLKAQ